MRLTYSQCESECIVSATIEDEGTVSLGGMAAGGKCGSMEAERRGDSREGRGRRSHTGEVKEGARTWLCERALSCGSETCRLARAGKMSKKQMM